MNRRSTINMLTVLLVLVAAIGMGAAAAWAQCQVSLGNGYQGYCSDSGGCAQYGGEGYTWGSVCTLASCPGHTLACTGTWYYAQTNCCFIGCYNFFCAGCKACG